MSSWFYMADSVRWGPIPSKELRELASRGIIQPNTLIWKEGLKDWIPARGVRGLPFVDSPVPPPPAVVAWAPPNIAQEHAEDLPVALDPPSGYIDEVDFGVYAIQAEELTSGRKPRSVVHRPSDQYQKSRSTRWGRFCMWLKSSSRTSYVLGAVCVVLAVVRIHKINEANNKNKGELPSNSSQSPAPQYSAPARNSNPYEVFEPEVASLDISPTYLLVLSDPGDKIPFYASAKDSKGNAMICRSIRWSCTLGSIDENGLLIVPNCNGCEFGVWASVRLSNGSEVVSRVVKFQTVRRY